MWKEEAKTSFFGGEAFVLEVLGGVGAKMSIFECLMMVFSSLSCHLLVLVAVVGRSCLLLPLGRDVKTQNSKLLMLGSQGARGGVAD